MVRDFAEGIDDHGVRMNIIREGGNRYDPFHRGDTEKSRAANERERARVEAGALGVSWVGSTERMRYRTPSLGRAEFAEVVTALIKSQVPFSALHLLYERFV
jgi:hypothetical protein